MLTQTSHALAISCGYRDATGVSEVVGASATLLWLDRPFVVTAAKTVRHFSKLLANDPNGRIYLGQLELPNPVSRLTCIDDRHNLATIAVRPNELDRIGPDLAFYNACHWPPRPAEPGEVVQVTGYPRDQWPAALHYTFEVQSVGKARFSAALRGWDMPGRMEGMCGAPVFRAGAQPELVGVVTDSMFHNELIRAQHAGAVDECGNLVHSTVAL